MSVAASGLSLSGDGPARSFLQDGQRRGKFIRRRPPRASPGDPHIDITGKDILSEEAMRFRRQFFPPVRGLGEKRNVCVGLDGFQQGFG